MTQTNQVKKTSLVLLSLGSLVIATLTSCISSPAPNLPDTWVSESAPLASEDLADGEIPKIHIFIMYGHVLPIHTTLRVYSPALGAVFWDPEGGYGSESMEGPEAKRVRDIIVDPVPSVEDYLYFRQLNPTAKTEVFEFHVEQDTADKLIRLLTPPEGDEKSEYNTEVDGPFCSSRISSFLQKYSNQAIETPRVCLPQVFSKYLYQQDPDRVIIAEGDLYLEYGPGGI